MFSMLQRLRGSWKNKRKTPTPLLRARLGLEALEVRALMAGGLQTYALQTNLVSDLPNVAQVQDTNLVNPWGISESAGSPFWISDNNAGLSTLYASNPNSKPKPTPTATQGLVVGIPDPTDLKGHTGAPTGTVFNFAASAGAFKLTKGNGNPAAFLFATEDGTIIGWNGGTEAVLQVDNSGNNFTEPDPAKQTGAVYKGLAFATQATPIFASTVDPKGLTTSVIYLSNFRAGTVEVYDSAFNRVKLPAGAFTDPDLPAGYAPFNVQVLTTQIGNQSVSQVYVTYALQNDTKHDDVGGLGHGFVDVYNLDGSGGTRLVSQGNLDSPWGVALAPKSFGAVAGDLLVGNFKNGHINVYNPVSGAFLSQLKDPDGEPITIDGLWALKVGNGAAGGDNQTVYFTAGIVHETHGLFGSLNAVAKGTPEGLAEQQAVQVFVDLVQIDNETLAKDIANNAPHSQIKQDIKSLKTDLRALVRAELEFARDAAKDAKHSHGKADSLFLGDLFDPFIHPGR
jgi:uncharacterized protein (TIGR03118 family)